MIKGLANSIVVLTPCGRFASGRVQRMARKLRVEYPGAIYHVMNRGDQREPIFQDDTDRECFLATLEAACPWSFLSPDKRSPRIAFENDTNCTAAHGPPFNANTKIATVEAVILLGCTNRMNNNWSGLGEQEAPGYELMRLYLDGNQVASAHAPGRGLGCVPMGPVVSEPEPPLVLTLPPGIHLLRIETDTNDPRFHFGAYYQFEFGFQPIE